MRLHWWSPGVGLAMMVCSSIYVPVLFLPLIRVTQSLGTRPAVLPQPIGSGFAVFAALVSALGLLLGVYTAIRKVRPLWPSVAGVVMGLLNVPCWIMFAVVTRSLAEIARSVH